MKKLQKLLLAAILCGMAVPVMNAAKRPYGNGCESNSRKKPAIEALLRNEDCLALVLNQLDRCESGRFLVAFNEEEIKGSIARANIPAKFKAICDRHKGLMAAHGGIDQDEANRLFFRSTNTGDIQGAEDACYVGVDDKVIEEWHKICSTHQGLVRPDGSLNKNQANKQLLRFCQLGRFASVLDMIHIGADVNTQDNEGNTALMLAVLYRHTEIIQTLLAHEANVNAVRHDGMTALMLAAYDQDATIFLILGAGHGYARMAQRLENGAHVNAELARILLGHKADVNAVNQQGRTALMLARQNDRTEIANMIEERIELNNPCCCAVQ